MPAEAVTELNILREQPRLGSDDRFCFECRKDLPCFTRCCRDVSIVLTPYDVVRLKRALRVDSSEFLERYTISPFTKEQKFPVVLLKMDAETRRCPFVSEGGCGVYAHRPWACRMYPLGLAEPKNPEERRFYFLVKEEICKGHALPCGHGSDPEESRDREGVEDACGAASEAAAGSQPALLARRPERPPQAAGLPHVHSVREWIEEQGIEEYELHGASFKDLMLEEFWDGKDELMPQQIEMFYTACFDLDRFRRFVFDTTLLERFEVDEARVEAMRNDDEELLEFAIQWLRFALLKQRTMRMRRR